MPLSSRTLRLSALWAAMAVGLAACGGGGDDSPAPSPGPGPAPTPAPETKKLSGKVSRNGMLQNVVVCLDLNSNNACDSSEPASVKTGADGAYSVDVTAMSAEQLAGARLIALVRPGAASDPGTALDSADPSVAATTKAYVLTRPAGTGGAINPLTTMVQAGIAGGMSEADARKNLAIQLALDPTKIDDYQSDPVASSTKVQDTTRLMATFVSNALRDGATLSVVDQAAEVTASAGPLTSLTYGGPGDYRYRSNDRLAKPAGQLVSHFKDARVGKAGGVALTPDQLYGTAYLGPNGWTYCDDTVRHEQTLGNPSRSNYCEGQPQVGYAIQTSAADRPMADVLNELKADGANYSYPVEPDAQLLGVLGNAKFPAGSEITRRTNLTVAPSIYTNAGDARPQNEATTLDQLIAAKPAASVKLPSPGGTLSLGVSTSNLRNLRVAFGASSSPTTGAVQYYECDLSADQNVASNCVAAGTGTYAIGTVHGVRVLRFPDQPRSIMNHMRIYAELDWGGPNGKWVTQARESKPDVASNASRSARLSPVAWEGMKAQLGI